MLRIFKIVSEIFDILLNMARVKIRKIELCSFFVQDKIKD